MKQILLQLIAFYQRTFSPDHSARGKFRHPHGYCKYYPSCSEYARQSIEKHGVLKGAMMGIWRIARCNPFSDGGVDLVKPLPHV